MTSSEHPLEHAADPARLAQPAGTTASATAEARVEAALGGVGTLADRPLADHAPAYAGLHDELQAVLAEIDGA